MALVVVEDELADPAGIGMLGAQGVMEVAESFAIAVEELLAWDVGRGRRLGWFGHGGVRNLCVLGCRLYNHCIIIQLLSLSRRSVVGF